MLDVYLAATPNGLKIKIFLEETGLAHRLHTLRLGKGDQFKPEFLAISPNNKIPALVDQDPEGGGAPIALFESGAILMYLAEKTGRFMPKDLRGRYEVLKWLFWQMAGLGPMAGQAGHFRVYAPEPVPYAIERYTKEVNRLYGVADKQLAEHAYMAGDYSIADMAVYPWIEPHASHGQRLEDFSYLKRWFEAVKTRPAVLRAYEGVEPSYSNAKNISEEERRMLFGQTVGSVKR